MLRGAAEYSMRVWIDPVKLAARSASPRQVLAAINNSNFAFGGARQVSRTSMSLLLDA